MARERARKKGWSRCTRGRRFDMSFSNGGNGDASGETQIKNIE